MIVTRGFNSKNIITRGYGIRDLIDAITKPVRIFVKALIRRFFGDNYIQETFFHQETDMTFNADTMTTNFKQEKIITNFEKNKKVLTFYESRPARR